MQLIDSGTALGHLVTTDLLEYYESNLYYTYHYSCRPIINEFGIWRPLIPCFPTLKCESFVLSVQLEICTDVVQIKKTACQLK